MSVPQPKASLDPSAKPMAVAIPTAATIEPLRPNTSAARFDGIPEAITRPTALEAKQIAPTGDIRPGLDSLTVM